MDKSMEKVFITGLMGQSIQVSGSKTRCMETASLYGRTDVSTLERSSLV
jgi:hypothetical protein